MKLIAHKSKLSSLLCALFLISASPRLPFAFAADRFDGKHFAGAGDVEYLKLLDISGRMTLEPDAQFQSMPMLYEPTWNGLVEGPTWDAWWIQNSYGGTYAFLPYAVEPWSTFIANSQAMWFAKQGDGKTPDKNGYVAPDGCLVDAANLKVHYYRQGDARHDIHDWFMEATAAGVVLQSEMLLISRDEKQIDQYLPQLERAANFIETRRDPKTGLYQGGVACNLLAPSFGGYLKPDGTRGLAFHAGLQVTYLAGLDRLIELEALAGHNETAAGYTKRRDLAKQSLKKLVSDEGYFLNSIDPDGTKHGLFGAPKHGYFESSVNHDAMCFRVADDALAKSIMTKMLSIPQLRPHSLIIPNYPCYDDMYAKPEALWAYGYWVNGGHWSTCEARMIMAYYRLGHQDQAAASMNQILKFAKQFRMDNDLTDFGNAVYQPNQPINITYDAYAIPAAMIRGLFEYLYKSDRVILIPHVPAKIVALDQKDPIRFGKKRLYISTRGSGHVSAVKVNGEAWTEFNEKQIELPFDRTPDKAKIEITLGYDAPKFGSKATTQSAEEEIELPPEWAAKADRLEKFIKALKLAGQSESYEAAHAKLTVDAIKIIPQRKAWIEAHPEDKLPEASAKAADQSYIDTPNKLFAGLAQQIEANRKLDDPAKKAAVTAWDASQ